MRQPIRLRSLRRLQTRDDMLVRNLDRLGSGPPAEPRVAREAFAFWGDEVRSDHSSCATMFTNPIRTFLGRCAVLRHDTPMPAKPDINLIRSQAFPSKELQVFNEASFRSNISARICRRVPNQDGWAAPNEYPSHTVPR